ncbi:MAG: hypothetical protein U0529_05795 [Thermoanaerobaculia bacterium]
MRSAERHLDECALLEKALTAGGPPDAHAETCARCRERIAAFASGQEHVRDVEGVLAAGEDTAPEPPAFLSALGAALRTAEQLVLAAETGVDALAAAVASSADSARFPEVVVHAAQIASRLTVRRPGLALAVVETVRPALARHADAPARRLAFAELQLLESQALLYAGRTAEARHAAREGLAALESAGAPLLLRSRALYYAGSAAWGDSRYEEALGLLSRARAGFAEDGQDAWIGRAEAAIGLVHFSQARFRDALAAFDGALERLDERTDPGPVEAVQQNRAGILMNLGRLADARAAFGKALELALRSGLTAGATTIRVNLLNLGLEEEAYEEVRARGEKLVATCLQEGLAVDAYYARLALAEAWAALGNYGAVRALVEVIRGDAPSEVRDDPDAMRLLERLDAGDHEVAGRLRRLRHYLSGRDRLEVRKRA